MDKKRAIELLIQAVDEIPHLKTLHYQNDEIKLWLDKVGNILRAGLKPEDYSKYWPVSQALEILKGIYEDNIYQEEYLRKITDYELALKSILLKYEVVGMEGKRDKGGEVEMVRRGKMDEKQRQKIIGELKDFYKELRSYKNRQSRRQETEFSEAQNRSLDALRLKLQREYGRLNESISKYGGTRYISRLGERHESFHYILSSLDIKNGTFIALDGAISAVNEAIGKLEAMPLAELELQEISVTEPPKAFIAHEGETKALGKLEDFLDALGVKHSIAEKEPSDGRQIEGQVASTYEQADFVIILATKGKAINRKTGVSYMGLNVADELGRAREAKKRIVLLLETGVDPHTNISGIVHERFTPQGMDKAFIKIASELKNWGFIRAGKVGA